MHLFVCLKFGLMKQSYFCLWFSFSMPVSLLRATVGHSLEIVLFPWSLKEICFSLECQKT